MIEIKRGFIDLFDSQSKEIISAFLAGLYDSEGYVCYRKEKGHRCIGLSMKEDREFFDKIINLLYKIGLSTAKPYYLRRDNMFGIEISNRNDIMAFAKNVDLSIFRKFDKLEEIKSSYSQEEELQQLERLKRNVKFLKQKKAEEIRLMTIKVNILERKNEQLQNNCDQAKNLLELPVGMKIDEWKVEPKPKPILQMITHIDHSKLLTLLQKAGAMNPMFSMQASDLKMKFRLQCTEKTLRNKLNDMYVNGLVSFSGLKPKRYYVTESGMNLLKKERQTMLQVEAIVPQV